MLKKITKALTITIIGAFFMLPGMFFLGGSIWLMLIHEGTPVRIALLVGMALCVGKIGLEEIKGLIKD